MSLQLSEESDDLHPTCRRIFCPGQHPHGSDYSGCLVHECGKDGKRCKEGLRHWVNW